MILRNLFLIFATGSFLIFLLIVLSKAKISPKNLLIRMLLLTFFIFVVVRLIGFVIKFGYEDLQMDFSAFYTGGEAINHGLSPYKNHITYDPPIWDGIGVFKYSRFIYFPLLGMLFCPIALLPYLYAKFFWMLFSIFSIGFALYIINKTVGLEDKSELSLIIGIIICLFYPLLTLLERGQIYGLTLLIMAMAIRLMLKDRKTELFSGILWAVAGSLHLYCVFVFPFLILRQKWKVIMGYIIGGIVIFLLTITTSGPKLLFDYIFNEMPRISLFGEGGTKEMLMSSDIIQKYLENVPIGMTLKDGIIYKPSSFDFVSNATLTRTFFGIEVSKILTRIGINATMPILSLFVLGIFFIFMLVWQLYHRKQFSHLTIIQEVIYWQIVLIIILLSAPLTWVMNVVWILPVVIIILHQYPLVASKHQAICLSLCTIALVFAALPDSFLISFNDNFIINRYIYAEILLFASLLCLLGNIPENHKMPESHS